MRLGVLKDFYWLNRGDRIHPKKISTRKTIGYFDPSNFSPPKPPPSGPIQYQQSLQQSLDLNFAVKEKQQ